MKRAFLCLILLSNCAPSVECFKIGRSYADVVKLCGAPTKHHYRAGYLERIEYYSNFGSVYVEVRFNKIEEVNFFHYKSYEIEKTEYTEYVE